ncbi:16S rRNA (guanine(966)-N(2))-methyltransferase RsmD [Methylocella sp.]|uniref:16S rRNA (guanine(966)-N(2))-methyltransferase RsmD n=1 Tax=Methylocella sp. TaxID=1978226 RepID=UPI003784B7BA
MRIVGGSFRGRALKAPRAQDIRPTSDRLRESLFDILAHAYGEPAQGRRALDVFAGTGALGLEAASRGAAEVAFVDRGSEACALIRANISALGLEPQTKLLRRDAQKLGASPFGAFGLVFLDPPYGRNLAPPALEALLRGGWLDEDALVVIEESASAAFAPPPGFSLRETRRFGDTLIFFAGRAAG